MSKKHHFRVPSNLPDTKGELLELKSRIDMEKASIDLQLAEAKGLAAATGVYTDRDWFIRASHAQRQYAQISQRIQMKLGHIRDEQKQKNVSVHLTAERHFIEVARERLLADFFAEIMEEAEFRARNKAETKPSIVDSIRTGEFL